MKITAIILLAGCLQVSAKTFSQNVNLSLKDAPLEQVFSELHKQTGFAFFYDLKEIKNAKPITINVKDKSLNETLNLCLKDQPVTYTIVGKTVVVKPATVDLQSTATTKNILNGFFPPPPIDVHGKVVNEKGEPVASVTVTVKGTRNATATDANGEFNLTGVDEKATLVFTSTNVETFEKKVNGKTDLAIKLKTKVSKLDDVQVIAYGTTTKRLSTGDISSVKADVISQQPVNNPLLALQGRVPGLFLSPRSGISGSNVTVRIQGLNSILNGNDPFYVIDGVPYNGTALTTTSNILNGGISPFDFIDPSMIESIEVLKDADATAIYGSRAANGAILITTKKGKAGQTKVDLRLQNGWGTVGSKIKLLNTAQYLALRQEAFKNDGKTPSATDYDVNGAWDQSRYTDWQKELIGGTAAYNDITASISGGNETTQFRFGTSYHRETTVYPGDNADRKAAIQFSLNHVSSNKKLHFQFSGNYLDDNNQLPDNDLTSAAIILAPDAPSLYTPDNRLNWAPLANGNSTWTNPLSYLSEPYNNRVSNLISNAVIKYQIIPGLEIGSSFGATKTTFTEIVKTPVSYFAPEYKTLVQASATRSEKNINSWIIEPDITYKINTGKGNLDMLLGSTFQNNTYDQLDLNASGFATDEQLDNLKSASTITVNNTVQSQYRYSAIFGRINYNLNDKYILNISGRRDGSSRFGPQNQFHTFYAVGGAWIFSDEKWVKDNLGLLSFGKLRASYGTTGSDQVGDYSFLNLYNNVNVRVPYQGVVGLAPTGLYNGYLAWEQTNKFNVGADLGFLKDRILLNVNYFKNRSSNQLLFTPLPVITGFNSIKNNLPATVQNSGLELVVDTKLVATKDFRWNSSINFTIPKNKLVDFPGLMNNPSYSSLLVIGQPIGITRAYQFAGVNPTTGVYQFINSNGQITSTPSSSTDKIAIINTAPRFYGGFQNSLSYKGIGLSFLFQYANQKAKDYHLGNQPGVNGNQPLSILGNYWQKAGDIANIEKLSTGIIAQSSFAATSNAAFTDASYLRLKNVSLSWQLPKRWCLASKLQQASVFAQAQNLWTLTKYDLDPETQLSSSLPTLRVITFGVQVQF